MNSGHQLAAIFSLEKILMELGIFTSKLTKLKFYIVKFKGL